MTYSRRCQSTHVGHRAAGLEFGDVTAHIQSTKVVHLNARTRRRINARLCRMLFDPAAGRDRIEGVLIRLKYDDGCI